MFKWKDYICTSCGSGYEGMTLPIEIFQSYFLQELDFYNKVNMCPFCGKEQHGSNHI